MKNDKEHINPEILAEIKQDLKDLKDGKVNLLSLEELLQELDKLYDGQEGRGPLKAPRTNQASLSR